MPVSASHEHLPVDAPRCRAGRILLILFAAFLLVFTVPARAASVRGVVTDTTGAKITGANVVLMSNGQKVASAVSTADGSFEILTGVSGRFFLLISAKSFRELQTPAFYASRLDNIERTIVLEPEWVRESIVVTATGTPTPQDQTSSATSVLGPLDIAMRDSFVDVLRLMPGAFTAQTGQRGAQASLFIRGGDSDDNKVLVDGVSAGDLGGRFDLGPFSSSAIESAEIYRGPNSDLYGADAETGVVSFTTPHGTTSFPSFLLSGDAGNFSTAREELEVAGAYDKLDYLGDYNWLQTYNDLPNDEFHVGTASGNLGYQLNETTQIRATVHYLVDGTGVPNAWDFYRVADQATQKDQNIFMSGAVDNQTTPSFHNSFRYGLTRKREQYYLWEQSGSGVFDQYGDSLGDLVTIAGANGYSATGRAILDFAGTYPYESQLVSNRDQIMYQGSYAFTPHLTGLVGFHYEEERGHEYIPLYSIDEKAGRNNYDYLASVHGDFKNRVFYTLGGSLEHYSLFGTETSPRAGLTGWLVRPRHGIFSGSRLLFNFGDAVREPSLTDQFGSLYQALVGAGDAAAATELHITPLAAPTARTYEGGGEQTFLSERIVLRASYFHNEFGRQIESVDARLLPTLIPGLTLAQQLALENALGYLYQYDYPLSVNTEAFRAQGIESEVEGGIGRSIFLRGGYTYLDSAVQRSFDSDNQAYFSGFALNYHGIPLGAFSPLWGARPFRRPPHTGFLSASYAKGKVTGILTASFASRSDDSTYLEDEDQNGGNSLLLPNRNLDFGFARIDLGGSYQLFHWLGFYAQAENLTDNQHIAPIGYVSLPFSIRLGARIQFGKGSSR
jgi:iron complex outermembrane receptor protein/vitamin B12 transporter